MPERTKPCEEPKYSIQTISRQVAIETDPGAKIVINDPDAVALSWPSWPTLADLAKKIADMISSPTFPVPPSGGNGGGDITIVVGDGNDGTVIIVHPREK